MMIPKALKACSRGMAAPTPVTEERWAALESNPEVLHSAPLLHPSCTSSAPLLQVLSSLCHLGGVPAQWGVVDVYGLDEELLAFVPQVGGA